jgi:hypothetical protein
MIKTFAKRFDLRARLSGDEDDRNVIGAKGVESRSCLVEGIRVVVQKRTVQVCE